MSILLVSCASGLIGQPTDQTATSQFVLPVGGSRVVSGTDLTITFEAVVEDSRCPRGVSCIRAGEAIVRLRVAGRSAASSTHLLHTELPSGREIELGDLRIRLVDVAPYPVADRATRPDEYRVTVSVQKK